MYFLKKPAICVLNKHEFKYSTIIPLGRGVYWATFYRTRRREGLRWIISPTDEKAVLSWRRVRLGEWEISAAVTVMRHLTNYPPKDKISI